MYLTLIQDIILTYIYS